MTSERMFYGVAALFFAISTTVTIVWCGSMPMPWMRMPGQTWSSAAASFLGMWLVMMVAMMLPSLVPSLRRYPDAVDRTGDPHIGRLTAMVSLAYFFIWTLIGLMLFPIGVALASVAMQWPALAPAFPMMTSALVLIAGALQFSAWKAHHLACCRESPRRGRTLPANNRTAWQHGLRLGMHCSYCTAGLTAILLVMGVMDLRVMAGVTAAITIERLAPNSERAARAIGVVIIGTGLLLLGRAATI